MFTCFQKTVLPILLLGVAGPLAHAAEKPAVIADKTLVAWLSPANLQQQGSGVVSIMNGEHFDAIVYSGNHITIYRNGQPYADYISGNLPISIRVARG